MAQMTVPQLSIMIIYNSTWSILSQWIRDILSGVLPVCDKPYHMNNGFQQMWVVIQNLWNHALWIYLLVMNMKAVLVAGTHTEAAHQSISRRLQTFPVLAPTLLYRL